MIVGNTVAGVIPVSYTHLDVYKRQAKTYVAPCKLSVAEWMAVWAQDSLVGIKASTAYLYKRTIELYIEPHLDHIRLDALNAHTCLLYTSRCV